ncbi:MAG: L-fuculose-phosphate aldolase [Atopobiaceae bacterium]|jgi:L-fuculose-phosphate aldolase|nr:L-fuculose-phosphate aldolase [Atopobiaceae bacterium]MCH4120509.1 L-fuculose-phosphate aldolase [Atopobiaceae bacterium]MCI1318727.1 L-fuculose-phosphate aldolase [Atopobiaceae bacterium]MCI1388210.1 L-fuculose-phosphate aldolase [Atopobiaceae bacterium]MCI1431540.1 L-fuculose-phosphate aldolase [Atopobiaceae bacterium]
MLLQEERELIVEYGKKLVQFGLTEGTFGNLSCYDPDEGLMCISPSGMDYFKTNPEDVVVLDLDGKRIEGAAKPSSEVDMHRIFYKNRPDVRAVVHTHSVFCTTIACMHKEIPPIHYNVAYCGDKVPCIPYVTFGTQDLAEAVYARMGDEYNACLLGNHGMIAVGSSMSFAFDVAEQIEFVAHLYYNTLVAGDSGVPLSQEDLNYVLGKFGSYRQR